ncbi:MAG: hypothetical protein ACP5QK_01640 [Myxococcota bacterium]
MKKILLILISIFIATNLSANNDAILTKAFGLFKAQSYNETIKICESVVEKDKDNLDAIYLMGISHFMLKNYQDAERYFTKFLSVNPYNYEVVKILAISKYYNGDYKGSISNFEKIPKYSNDTTILIYLALNYNRLNDRENLNMLIDKIEKDPKIEHKNKEEFIRIIKRAMQGDSDATISNLVSLRDKYENPFVISSKIISIEKNTRKDKSENFRLLLSINEAFDSNVVLYPDSDAIKLPEVKYAERYDLRTEARYSVGYRIVNTSSHLLGIIYNGYQGVNSNIHKYNFNSNDLQILYKFTRPAFQIGITYDYTYDFISNNLDAYSFGHKLTPEFNYHKGNAVIGIGASTHLRHFFEKPYMEDYNRSSLLVDPYILFSYSISPGFTIYNKDYYGINNAEGDGWRYQRPEFRLGFNYKYGRSIILNALGGFGYYMFSEKVSNPYYLVDNKVGSRTDMRIAFELGVDLRLYSDKLFLNTGYSFLKNTSNVKGGMFDYTRNIASLGLKFVY